MWKEYASLCRHIKYWYDVTMRNEEGSIADIARGKPAKEVSSETVFEGDERTIFHARLPYITQQIIKHSFGFITEESQVNKILVALVGILFCVAIIIIIWANFPINKVPTDVLHLNMERMRSK